MRKSPVSALLSARGAVFEERCGVEVAKSFSTFEEEYWAVREAAGLTDFSFTTRYRIPESGLDTLESYAAGSVADIRFGRILHTLAADDDGLVESDLYIANDDEHFLLIGESLVTDNATYDTLGRLGGRAEEIEDLSTTTALFGIDGYKAWAVAKELFGADILGLPYLSVETYELQGVEIKVMRGGKTSEFGYLMLVPAEDAENVIAEIERAGQPFGLKHVGLDTHQVLRLDGRFFNVHAEGREVRDPLALGLQWMIDFEGEDFRGREAILARRSRGLREKIIGVVQGDDKRAPLIQGTTLCQQGREIARIVAAAPSPFLGRRIGLALFNIDFAYSGLEFEDKSGNAVQTVSMPPFTPKSLTVKLDEM